MTPDTQPIEIAWTNEEAPQPVNYTWSDLELIPIYEVEAAAPEQDAAATS